MHELYTGEEMDNIIHSSRYSLDRLTSAISDKVYQLTGADELVSLLPPPGHIDADFGLNLLKAAKQSGWNPAELTDNLADDLLEDESLSIVDQVEVTGPYLNLSLEMSQFPSEVIDEIIQMGDDYGKENIGKGQVVVVDMSSPNIAKRMSYGHLRSTIIGDSVSNMYEAMGYEAIRDNHIGDWGTQFGKLITAIKYWGDEKKIMRSEDPIGELQKLYVRFHKESDDQARKSREQYMRSIAEGGIESIPGLDEVVEQISQDIMTRKGISRRQLNIETIIEDALDVIIDTDLDKEGREWFYKLEQGNREARRLWKLCVDLSLEEFDQIYDVLGVDFDVVYGESFYENLLDDVTYEVEESGVGQVSDGALVVDMTDKNLGVAIIRKSDGASVYMTRDLACALYREHDMNAAAAIYVVGADQKLYFQQLFEILRRLGHEIGHSSKHVYFGMVDLPEGKMSSRAGRVILLKDVIEEGFKRVEKRLAKDLPGREEITRQIAVGAIKWSDLGEDPKRSITFDWDRALSMEGYSAPYVQYTAVRARSILDKARIDDKQIKGLDDFYHIDKEGMAPAERELILSLAKYPQILRGAAKDSLPSDVAKYVFGLAQDFNSFYNRVSVMRTKDREVFESRLRLVHATTQVISNALGVLGIEIPDAM